MTWSQFWLWTVCSSFMISDVHATRAARCRVREDSVFVTNVLRWSWTLLKGLRNIVDIWKLAGSLSVAKCEIKLETRPLRLIKC